MSKVRILNQLYPYCCTFDDTINCLLFGHKSIGTDLNVKIHSKEILPLFHARGRYFVYLSDGDVAFFRASFSPIFSRTGYGKKSNFLEQVVKTCEKRRFCYNGLSFSQISCF